MFTEAKNQELMAKFASVPPEQRRQNLDRNLAENVRLPDFERAADILSDAELQPYTARTDFEVGVLAALRYVIAEQEQIEKMRHANMVEQLKAMGAPPALLATLTGEEGYVDDDEPDEETEA